MKVILSEVKTFVLTLDKMSVIWKCVLTKILKLYLYILVKDALVRDFFLCDFVVVDNINIDTSNHSNICVCNFVEMMECDSNYSAPIMTDQLLQFNYTLIRNLLPTPIGMNLTLTRNLLQYEYLK